MRGPTQKISSPHHEEESTEAEQVILSYVGEEPRGKSVRLTKPPVDF